MGVTALGSTLKEARAKAYEGTGKIYFKNKYMRTDIGRAIEQISLLQHLMTLIALNATELP